MARALLVLWMLAVITTPAIVAATDEWDTMLNDLWPQFISSFDKNYASDFEMTFRRSQWKKNMLRIRDHNLRYDLGLESFYMGVNQFTDLDQDEFSKIYLSHRISERPHEGSSSCLPNIPVQSLPSAVDWRKNGYVTPVKDQGLCGSCWAFSTTGSLEGQHFKKTGQLISLSEQQLVDCSDDYPYMNNGCLGGLMDIAFHYIKDKGITSEAVYPYSGLPLQNCTYKESTKVATCSGYCDLPKGNESALQTATATVGPISVAIDATENFQHYKGGIFSDTTCSSDRKKLNHGVLTVGYGIQGNQPYWIVKNSWGASWGMKGYILMSRNRKNQCGISTLASYPLV